MNLQYLYTLWNFADLLYLKSVSILRIAFFQKESKDCKSLIEYFYKMLFLYVL